MIFANSKMGRTGQLNRSGPDYYNLHAADIYCFDVSQPLCSHRTFNTFDKSHTTKS